MIYLYHWSSNFLWFNFNFQFVWNNFQLLSDDVIFFLQVLIFSLRIKLKYTELTKRQCFPNIFFVITTNSFWLLLWKECLNSDGQEFYNINKTNNYLSPQIIEHKKDHNIMHVIINCLAGVIISMLDSSLEYHGIWFSVCYNQRL
jgi:RsiW-degrading membrane proteinase PrsW (M82 family)